MQKNDSLSAFNVNPGDKLSAERENKLLRRLSDMSLERAPGRRTGPGGSVETFPFEVSAGISLHINVEAGHVIFNNSALAYAGITNYTVPASKTNGVVYAFLDDDFSPTAVGVSYNDNLPAQPNAPARKYLALAEIDTDTGAVTNIDQKFKGDIAWPSIFGFWA